MHKVFAIPMQFATARMIYFECKEKNKLSIVQVENQVDTIICIAIDLNSSSSVSSL